MSENKSSGLQEKTEMNGGGRSVLLGVFTILGVFMVAVAFGILPSYFGLRKVKPLCEKQALQLTYDENKATYVTTKENILKFVTKADAQDRQELKLSIDELNSLVANEPKLSFLKGVIKFKGFDKSEIIADLSIPMHKNPRFDTEEELYLNGEARFEATFRKKKFWLRFAGLKIKGELIDLDIINAQSERNMIEYLSLNDYFRDNFDSMLTDFYKIKNIIADENSYTFTNWRPKEEKK